MHFLRMYFSTLLQFLNKPKVSILFQRCRTVLPHTGKKLLNNHQFIVTSTVLLPQKSVTVQEYFLWIIIIIRIGSWGHNETKSWSWKTCLKPYWGRCLLFYLKTKQNTSEVYNIWMLLWFYFLLFRRKKNRMQFRISPVEIIIAVWQFSF